MVQKIHRGFQQMLDEASLEITTIAASEATLLGKDSGVVLVDLRDPREREREGTIPGAFHCPRGMLEFWIDPQSPYHKPEFAQDKQFVFFCAAGWRSALAAQTAQKMGLQPVAHIEGGFAAWRDAGGAIDRPDARKPAKSV